MGPGGHVPGCGTGSLQGRRWQRASGRGAGCGGSAQPGGGLSRPRRSHSRGLGGRFPTPLEPRKRLSPPRPSRLGPALGPPTSDLGARASRGRPGQFPRVHPRASCPPRSAPRRLPPRGPGWGAGRRAGRGSRRARRLPPALSSGHTASRSRPASPRPARRSERVTVSGSNRLLVPPPRPTGAAGQVAGPGAALEAEGAGWPLPGRVPGG